MINLTDNAPCGIFAFQDDGSIFFVNQFLCDLTGYNKEELINKNVESIFSLPTRIFCQTHFFPLLKLHGHAEEIFFTLRAKDGQDIPVLLNAKRSVEEPAVTTCAFISVPNRKKFEDELVAARKIAESALKDNEYLVKAKNDFQQQAEHLEQQIQLAGKQKEELKQVNHAISHNLKEPLRKMLIYLEKLQIGTPERSEANMRKLETAAMKMKATISDLQQYVWVQTANKKFTEVNLNQLISDAIALTGQKFQKVNIRLSVEEMPMLEADAEQVSLMLFHILTNAVMFRKGDEANITISGTIIKQNAFKNLLEYKYENYVKVEIKDEGIGFEPMYKESIFELFKRLDFTEGQGLGLALCRKIAENHSGVIFADSKPGEGTTITIIFPQVQRVDGPKQSP